MTIKSINDEIRKQDKCLKKDMRLVLKMREKGF